jgi:hypothetical protein
MKNTLWALATAHRVMTLRDEGDPEKLVGLYLNEIKEVVGQRRFMQLMAFTDNCGLTAKKRQTLMRLARTDGIDLPPGNV